jgi:hypothetical protein
VKYKFHGGLFFSILIYRKVKYPGVDVTLVQRMHPAPMFHQPQARFIVIIFQECVYDQQTGSTSGYDGKNFHDSFFKSDPGRFNHLMVA